MIRVPRRLFRVALFVAVLLTGIASGQAPATIGTVFVQVSVPEGSPEGIEIWMVGRGRTVGYRRVRVTDATGAARFDKVPLGGANLEGRAEGIGRSRRVRVSPGDNHFKLRLRPESRPYGHVSGTVVDQEGNAIPHAHVHVQPLPNSRGSGRERRTLADANGRFGFRYLGEDNYRVEITRQNTVTFVEEVRLRARDNLTDVRWSGQPGNRLRGAFRGRSAGWFAKQPWPRLLATKRDSWRPVERALTVSGLEYSAQLGPGRWVVTAGQDHADNRIVLGEVAIRGLEDARLDLDFEPPPEVQFDVRVLVDGAAPEPRTVQLVPNFQRSWIPEMVTRVAPEGEARTDDEGWARFSGVLPGEGILWFRIDGGPETGTIVNRQVRVPEDNGIVLDATAVRVTGRIVDSKGDPILGTTMSRAGGYADLRGCWSHDICEFPIIDGGFTTPPLAAGPANLSFWVRGYAAGRIVVDVDPHDPSPQPVTIVLQEEAELSVDVKFPAKPTSPSVRFTVCRDAECDDVIERGWRSSRRYRGGMYEIDELPVGDWYMRAWSGYEQVGPIPITVPGPPVTVDLVSTNGRITALVPDLYGHEMPLELRLFELDGTSVSRTNLDCTRFSNWTSSGGGRVTAICVPPGPYWIEVEAADGRVWEKRVEVRTYRSGETRLRQRHLRRNLDTTASGL